MVSRFGLLVILSKCSFELQDESDRQSAMALIRGLVKHGMADGSIVVEQQLIDSDTIQEQEVLVKYGIVSWEGTLGSTFDDVNGSSAKYVILAAWRFRRQAKASASLFVLGLGGLLESGLKNQDWTKDPLLVLQQQASGVRRRADRALRLALLELPSGVARQPRRASALAQRLKLACPTAKPWQDGAYMRRNLLASRKCMWQGVSFAVTVDKSGFPPHEFLSGSVLDTSSGRVAWLPPQAFVDQGSSDLEFEKRHLPTS